MGRDLDRYVWIPLLLILSVGFSGVSAAPKRAALSSQTVTDPQGVTGWIKNMEIVIRDGVGRKPSHTYRHFSPLQSRTEGHYLIIDGKVLEALSSKEADFTMTLHVAPPHHRWDEVDAELYEDYRDEEQEH